MNGDVMTFAMNLPCDYKTLSQQDVDIQKDYFFRNTDQYKLTKSEWCKLLGIGMKRLNTITEMLHVDIPTSVAHRTKQELADARAFITDAKRDHAVDVDVRSSDHSEQIVITEPAPAVAAPVSITPVTTTTIDKLNAMTSVSKTESEITLTFTKENLQDAMDLMAGMIGSLANKSGTVFQLQLTVK